MQQMTWGLDVACRAAHQAALADDTGRLVWTGRKIPNDGARLGGGVGSAASRGRTDRGHGAHPERVGAVGVVVSSPRRSSDSGSTRASRRPAGLLLQTRQVGSVGL